jgi:hypothetical protein
MTLIMARKVWVSKGLLDRGEKTVMYWQKQLTATT